ncbi:15-cis-phytoene desaturase, chloroplastic/chromoplastic [Phoenix dactylifera]|uniref:15-cis-phytoene desaturase, chloroplastic/chromoplastic n=1 Tax=Phoenix dactylifera TaxID=42345 RepID=A0A8B7D0M3_PHODC|nr:15-cis-phytoene desaturase, chloroplastic/chromoplastic [Phoenix dactylifera]
MTLLFPPLSHSTFTPPKPHVSSSLPPRAIPSASPSTVSTQPGAIIVGAGLAGLAAATHLAASSVPFLLLEASDAVGGRVHTDSLDGFLLDRGFQIFLTAYPEARRLLDYPSLHLRPFYPGALVYHARRFHRVADPFRRPLHALASLPNPIGSLPDKLLVGLARLRAASLPDSVILSAPESPISDRLRAAGFSSAIVDRFFRPFLAGIFFDPNLATTSRLFDFVFKCLALGDNALPAAGISAIPAQLAARLPPGSLRLRSRVVAVDAGGGAARQPSVTLEEGDAIAADLGVIVAVEQPEAEKLLPQAFPGEEKKPKPVRSTVCLYFSADRAPVQEPILILNGSGEGIVNNMFFATNVTPSYAPVGKVLASVSLIGAFPERSDEDLTAEVVRELTGWFGSEVGSWRHLRTYRIEFAQPDQTPPTNLVGKEPRVGEGVYVCGDHRTSATFDGALVSGRRAAEALIRDRGLSKM